MTAYTCPACSRVLYDRRKPACGYCGASIPEELRLSAEEVEKYEQEKKRIEQQRQEDRAEEEEAHRKAAAEPPPYYPG